MLRFQGCSTGFLERLYPGQLDVDRKAIAEVLAARAGNPGEVWMSEEEKNQLGEGTRCQDVGVHRC